MNQSWNWISTHPWIWIAIIAHLAVLGTVAYLILLERKIASWTQDRIGPNRVGLGFGIIPWLKDKGMFGLGQPLADGLKFFLKEDYRPRNVDKVLFTIAPMVMMLVVIVSIAVLPWGGIKQTTRLIPLASTGLNADQIATWNRSGSKQSDPTVMAAVAGSIPLNATIVSMRPNFVFDSNPMQYLGIDVTYRYAFQIADLNIGVLFILAVLSLAVYGVVVGGWASNNKYSFLGGLRATANMISYEVPLGLSILTIVVMFGTLDLNEIVDKQAHYWAGFIPAWNVFCQPMAFLMFLICIHAEANRAPFDIAEAEQELVGGYHTEYSAMRFALFFLAEYAGMITTSAVCVALFFGGWHIPWIDKIWPIWGAQDPASPAVTTSLAVCIVRAIAYFVKTLAVIGIFMWVRWSLPRFRFDQIMNLAWRALIPIALLILLATAILIWLLGATARPYMRVGGWMAIWLLIVNAIALAVIVAGSLIVPAAPDTNRRLRIPGSRFNVTPVPGSVAMPG